MCLGDPVLFYRNRGFFLRGTIAYKTRSRALARELWQTPEDEPAWEFVYFISDLTPVEIAVQIYNRTLGYKPWRAVQSFRVHDEQESLAIIDAMGLEAGAGTLLTSVGEVTAAEEAFEKLGDDLDMPGTVKRRLEQSLLRKILLGKKTSECCALCGADLPVDLLVIGHIRKRHSCPPELKKDLANVMPVCLLGCDRLFENGYVVVDQNGAIQPGPSWKVVPSVQSALQRLVGRQCGVWSESSEAYFRWHRDHHYSFA